MPECKPEDMRHIRNLCVAKMENLGMFNPDDASSTTSKRNSNDKKTKPSNSTGSGGGAGSTK